MATREELQADLAKLQEIRSMGVRRVQYASGETEYRSDAEIAAAIADLERRIASVSGATPLRVTYLTSSKGT